jgi:glycosyltransferase involved in cell wall biosynthesis
MPTPKLSIITVNLNNAEGLRKTIESVVSQTFTNYEYIIIDGGSTDGSVEIIKLYADTITYWVSEPDKGIYNAMNKGIMVAKGEYCQFLNSGDWLVNENVLKEVFADFPDVDIVYGDLETEKGITKYPEKLTLANFFYGSLPHPSTFIKSELFQTYGHYNENNKIVSDWEFFILTLIINQCPYKRINHNISFFEAGGISDNVLNTSKYLKEVDETLKKYFPLMYEDYVEYHKIKTELITYNNSRIIQFIKRLQNTWIYNLIFVKKYI